jgi:hypothetical protein
MTDFNTLVTEYSRAKSTKQSSATLTQYKCNVLKYLKNINDNLQQYVQMFNMLIGDMTSMITKDYPHKVEMKTYHDVIFNLIRDTPFQPISLFITEIYANDVYRNNILDGNDKFFEKSSFDDVVQNDRDKIQIMSQIKSCWKDFSNDKRDYIKNAVKMMVNITSEYIISKDEGKDSKNMIIWYDGNM